MFSRYVGVGTAVVAVDAASVAGHTGVLASVGREVLDAHMGREAFAGGADESGRVKDDCLDLEF